MKKFLDYIENLVEQSRSANALEFHDHREKVKKEQAVVCEWCEHVLNGKT
jgi:hypothetical protein